MRPVWRPATGKQLRSLVPLSQKAATPSTDLNRLKKVLPGESWNGLVIVASQTQSVVRHTLTLLSSDWVAIYCPTGSQQTPLTKPWCASSFRSASSRYPHQMITLESSPTEARYLSLGDQARSVTSLSCPGKRLRAFQPSTLGSSSPQAPLPPPLLRDCQSKHCHTARKCSVRIQIPDHDDGIIRTTG